MGQVLESDRMRLYGNDFTPEEQRILRKEIAAGYMLFNLKRMREDGIQHRLTEFYKANYPRLRLPEQDCLILCCYPHVRQMPLRFVVANTYYRIPPAEAAFCTFSDVFPPDRKACEDRYADALPGPSRATALRGGGQTLEQPAGAAFLRLVERTAGQRLHLILYKGTARHRAAKAETIQPAAVPQQNLLT